MEDLVATMSSKVPFGEVFQGKRVLVTGHTGFKGFWLTTWLLELGAKVIGCALDPPTEPSAFETCGMASRLDHHVLDIRSRNDIAALVKSVRPHVIFHMAAQAIVREAYTTPAETFDTNVSGTVNVLEAVRLAARPCAVVVVTSDKCYLNRGKHRKFVETDPLGGNDPYSASKACAEITVASYRSSFFPPEKRSSHGISLASVRAGNVIGGGDWAKDRLLPDIIRSLVAGKPVPIRNPHAVRPWQFVLEPLSGYLRLASLMLTDQAQDYSGAYNFGPSNSSAIPVAELADRVVTAWGKGSWKHKKEGNPLKEVDFLALNWCKAAKVLGWHPSYDINTAISTSVHWYKRFYEGGDMFDFSLRQIGEYVNASLRRGAAGKS